MIMGYIVVLFVTQQLKAWFQVSDILQINTDEIKW